MSVNAQDTVGAIMALGFQWSAADFWTGPSDNGGKGAVAVWRTADRDFQDFGTYNVSGGDPVMCYIKVKTDAVGSAGLVKNSEDGKVEGIQFQITGSDGSSTTKTTDASGNIDIEGLPIYSADGSKITYTAAEINVPNKYVNFYLQNSQLWCIIRINNIFLEGK